MVSDKFEHEFCNVLHHETHLYCVVKFEQKRGGEKGAFPTPDSVYNFIEDLKAFYNKAIIIFGDIHIRYLQN